MRLFLLAFGLVAGWASLALGAGEARSVLIGGGTLVPLFPPSPTEKEIPIPAFRLDRTPVTNAEFLQFVLRYPEWQRGRVSRLFAQDDYLKHWDAPIRLGHQSRTAQPVVNVSWFAAKAYCEAQGGRLPEWFEWEFAGSADATRADARSDPEWQARILNWYARPGSAPLGDVGQGPPDFFGLQDMHGLVWEWVLDFNSLLVSVDARESGSPDRSRFCGSGSLNATDKSNYALFMRTAYLSALKPAYTTSNLGFRCAYDVKGTEP